MPTLMKARLSLLVLPTSKYNKPQQCVVTLSLENIKPSWISRIGVMLWSSWAKTTKRSDSSKMIREVPSWTLPRTPPPSRSLDPLLPLKRLRIWSLPGSITALESPSTFHNLLPDPLIRSEPFTERVEPPFAPFKTRLVLSSTLMTRKARSKSLVSLLLSKKPSRWSNKPWKMAASWKKAKSRIPLLFPRTLDQLSLAEVVPALSNWKRIILSRFASVTKTAS
mmetsp:Transcript_36040/g.87104  ORF Transcript_36040/g.87104 Transcript_36040/m.87104 type:complete len:223 (+) Transcript_36040:678-1346(+)